MAPTCTSQGMQKKVCTTSGCENTIVETVAVTGVHNWSEWTALTVSETTDGLEIKQCTHCGKIDETRTAYATGAKGLAYNLISGKNEYEVEKGSVTSGAVVIPAYHKGYDGIYKPVTQIAQYAFDATGITSVIISSTVTVINAFAFSNCRNLVSVVIPASVTDIAPAAFYNSTLTNVFYGGADLTAWNGITINNVNNSSLTYATKYYYSETQKAGSYWHYVNGVPTKWN